MHFQLNECVGLVCPCSIYVVCMALTKQQEMIHHRTLNATTCNLVLLTKYLWKAENISYIFPVAVYFSTYLLDCVLVYKSYTWQAFLFSFLFCLTFSYVFRLLYI